MRAFLNIFRDVAAWAWPILRIIFALWALVILRNYNRYNAGLGERVAAVEVRAIRAERAAEQYYTLGAQHYDKLDRILKLKRNKRKLRRAKFTAERAPAALLTGQGGN